MSEAIVFISHQRLMPGKFEGYSQHYQQVVEMTERDKPGTVAHLAYANADHTEISIIHIFPDAEAMVLHLRGVAELAQKAYEYMEITSIEIYGRPNAATLENMQQIVGAGIQFRHMPDNVGGYLRLKPE